jgi:hypothetical protein
MGGQVISWTEPMLNRIRKRYHIDGPAKLANRWGISKQAVYNKKRELDRSAKETTPTTAALPRAQDNVGSELVPTGSVAATNIAPLLGPAELVAMRPEDMQVAQSSLAEWFRAKLDLVRQEAHDAMRNLEIAVQSAFKADSFKRASYAADRRVQFYEKCLAAIEAGYAIVPDFPVDVLAIRVTREHPKWRSVTCWEKNYALHPEAAAIAPAGEGHYVNPQPYQTTSEQPKKKLSDGREIEQYRHTIGDYAEVEFPVQVAQPAVMEATRAAMMLNLFDEIGCRPARRKPDPIVIGRIHKPWDRYRDNPVSFLIAWWIDTRQL